MKNKNNKDNHINQIIQLFIVEIMAKFYHIVIIKNINKIKINNMDFKKDKLLKLLLIVKIIQLNGLLINNKEEYMKIKC